MLSGPKSLIAILGLVLVAGCSSVPPPPLELTAKNRPVVDRPVLDSLVNLPEMERQPIVAVYDFPDLTGQRKDRDGAASFSNAVTQGGTALLIDALKNAGHGRNFRVVERNRIDDLAKERQIVRQTRDEYDGEKSNKLDPMLFAGLILQGGIIGYDSNVSTGGAGARYLGIGASTQYRKDQVTVSLRAVSTATGEVLLNVQVTKTLLSTGSDLTVFKFFDSATRTLETEAGMSQNEANTRAVKTAIEGAVVELVMRGAERGLWVLKIPPLQIANFRKQKSTKSTIRPLQPY